MKILEYWSPQLTLRPTPRTFNSIQNLHTLENRSRAEFNSTNIWCNMYTVTSKINSFIF